MNTNTNTLQGSVSGFYLQDLLIEGSFAVYIWTLAHAEFSNIDLGPKLQLSLAHPTCFVASAASSGVSLIK